MRTFKEDYAFGTQNENETADQLKVFDPTITKSKDRYAPFDFVGTSVSVELKTRNVKKDTYPTTMISASKVQHAKSNPEHTHIFAFKFQDGLYYIRYDATKFETYETKQGGRFDRGRPELNQYVYIPIEDLTLLTPADLNRA